MFAGEVEQPCDGVAVRAVATVRDVQRAGRICGNHLDLHALHRRRASAGEAIALRKDAGERVDEPRVGEEEIDEAGPGDLRALDL